MFSDECAVIKKGYDSLKQTIPKEDKSRVVCYRATFAYELDGGLPVEAGEMKLYYDKQLNPITEKQFYQLE